MPLVAGRRAAPGDEHHRVELAVAELVGDQQPRQSRAVSLRQNVLRCVDVQCIGGAPPVFLAVFAPHSVRETGNAFAIARIHVGRCRRRALHAIIRRAHLDAIASLSRWHAGVALREHYFAWQQGRTARS